MGEDEGSTTLPRVTLSCCSAGSPNASFASIIEADHFTIQRLVAKFRKSQARPQLQKDVLIAITWHLIRHDVSEELVMRPAFEHFMGLKGREMAENDRLDHSRAKQQLLSLLQHDLKGSQSLTELILEGMYGLFDELARHMAIESGQMIPDFEKLLSAEESKKLAGQYARTLVLTPEVTVLQQEHDNSHRRRCFRDVEEYMTSPIQKFKSIMQDLEHEAVVGPTYIDQMIRLESERLQIGKWQTFSQNKIGRKPGKL